jgi:SAM-dependent methyltransferase
MNKVQMIVRNLRALLSDDAVARRQAEDKRAESLTARQGAAEERLDALGAELERRLAELREGLEKRADAYETGVNARLDGFEQAVSARLDGYEAAVDARIEGRFAAVEGLLETRLTSVEARMDVAEHKLDERLDEVAGGLNERLNHYESAVDERLETRMEGYEASVDERLESFMNAADERLESYTLSVDERFEGYTAALDGRTGEYEASVDERLDAYTAATDARFDEYTRAVDARADERLAQIEVRSDERTARHAAEVDDRFAKLRDDLQDRFDQRTRALDTRADDRLMNLERNIEQRLTGYERGVDERLTARERFVDGVLESMREDLVERTDIMLHAIEQRQDRLRVLLKSAAGLAPGDGARPHELLPALPKFSDIAGQPPSSNGSRQDQGQGTLLDRIIEWKKHSAEKLNEFSPDEQEIADYILSFITDPNDAAYVRLHMRRFVATVQRIPPAQRTSARALELGSYVQLTPAIKKYAGYSVVKCADLWDAPEKVEQVELKGGGGEKLKFELRNFDAEREPFPYPDGHFQLVLCGEMIEHLSHDPMHMLWEANRVLEDGGHLLLTTPNITSARAIEGLLTGYAPYLMSQYNVEYPPGQHHREYAPREIRRALEAAGFTVLELDTEDVWLRSNPAILELLEKMKMPTELRGDNIFALARKTSSPVERYPKELYVSEGEKTPA